MTKMNAELCRGKSHDIDLLNFGSRYNCLLSDIAHAQNASLAMSVEGHGPVAVFEAGFGQTRKTWDAIVPTLSKCLTVVTYDRLA
jgi:hypothetical protein